MEIKILFLDYCPYSQKTFDLLDSKGVKYEKEQVSKEEKEDIKKKHFYPTFPQVFIDGIMIGGFTDTKELDERGFFESKDMNTLVDKIELGKMTESMKHVLLAKNYMKSKDKKKAKEELNKAIGIYDNMEANELLRNM